jgi:nitrate reductase NapE
LRRVTAVDDADKKLELRSFLLLVVVLAPVLAVGIVGGYGFLVWFSQMFFGPPGV